MKRITTLLLITLTFLLLLLNESFGQRGERGGSYKPKGKIEGVVLDEQAESPIEYVNAVLFKAKDSTMVDGTVTDVDGKFTLGKVKFGKYYLEFDFVGFRKKIVEDINVNPRNQKFSTDTVYLEQAAHEIEGVEVTGDRVDVEHKVDKKVINVGQDYSAEGGSAVEVLENVPSVEVDVEGNVELRGSGSFRVLINGKPSVLEGSDALQQMAASRIKSIEIITNPSAKYDPEGTAGIINVITKKQKEKGLNGQIKATAGTNDKYDASVNLNYQTGKFNFFGSFDYRDFNFDMDGRSERELYSEDSDTTTFINQDVERSMGRSGYSFKTGFDYELTESSTISLSGKLGNFGFGHDMERKTTRAIIPSDIPTNYSVSNSDFLIDHDYYSLSFDYQNEFDEEGHKLDGSIYYSNSASDDENQWASDITNSEWEIISENYKERNTETGEEDELQVKLDYTRPTSQGKLEAGYMGSYDYSDNQYEVEQFDFENDNWNTIDDLRNSYDYERLIHALYATYHGEIIDIDYKLGLRGEYTNRQLSQNMMDSTYKIDRFDIFPSAHFSKELNQGEQIFLSYSRRIRRPRSWYLDPFPRQPDQYSKRIGNPDLKPEYTDSYELGYKKSFNKSFFSIESYYRRTTDEIDRIRTRGENEEMLRTFENLDTETSYGFESMINTSLYKWWDLNANARLYRYTIEGNVTGEDVSAKSNNWNARLTNTFKLPTSTRIQLMAGYRGPSATAQGEREGFLMSSAAIKQSMLDKKLNVTLSVRDLFQTMKHERTSTGDDFREYNRFERESPIFRLSLSYSFNNYKDKKRGVNGEDEDFEGRGEF
ncbi:MAG: TonB-dependent receptor domain-containing protein [Bacteroidota bacterium]